MISKILLKYWAGCEWTLVGNTYEGLTWLDDSAKPTEQEINDKIAQYDTDIAWDNLRAERDKLLAESDWTQIPDAPLTEQQKSDWATYRKSLRDLPENTPDPANPTYPEKP